MANRITLRHGSTAPSASNLLPYELGWNENNLGLYIGQPSGEPLLISSGGGNVTGVKGSAEQNYRHGNVEITAANIGLGNVENTKLSTWTGSTKITTLGTITAGIIPWARLSDIPAISIATDSGTSSITLAASTKYKLTAAGSSYVFTTPPNTWNALSTSQAGYVAKAPNDTGKFLRGDATWAVVTASNVGLGNVENTKLSTWAGSSNITTLGTISTGTIPWARLSNVPSNFTPASHSHGNIANGGTIASTAVALANGDMLLFSDSSNSGKIERSSITIGTGTSTYLRNDGTWATPTNTWNALSTSQAGYVAQAPNDTLKFLRGDATWAQPSEAALVWGGKNFSGSYGCIDAAMIDDLGANRFAFLKAAGLTIEYSTNGGSSWTDYGATDVQKTGLFGAGQSFVLGKHSTAGTNTVNDQLRVTIATSAAGIYTTLNKIAIFMSTNGSTVQVKMEKALESTPTSFSTHLDWTGISGWSGWNILNISGITTYGNTAASQYGRIRFTFRQTAVNTNYASANISRIMGFGGMGWTIPSNMARDGHLYSYDNAQNATFPAQITATQFNGPLNGNATSATKATQDGNGATISSTYLKLSGGTLTGVLTAKGSMYEDSYSGALNMNNSNIYGVNSIYTADSSDNAAEGIHFYRDSTHVDTLWMSGGDILFVPNRALGTSTTKANSNTVLHSGNYTNYTVSKSGAGATGDWGINITGSSASCTGNAATATSATTASKLANTTKIGDTNQPVYFTASGEPAAISYTIAKSVPSNAVFTDTWKALSTSQAGYVAQAPNDTGKFLRGDATWAVVTATNVGLGNVSNNVILNSTTGVKGDIIYWSAENTPARLTNTSSTTKKFLSITSQVPSWTTLSNSDVGLGNVENTKLSTWTGSTAITTLGTIATGSIPLNNITSADDLKAIEALTGTTGLLKKTAANTWTLDTTAYTSNTGTVTKVTAGTGLSIGTTAGGNFTTTGTINHTNSVTAQTTQALYPIKIDACGHITAYGTAVTSLPASDVYDWAKASTKPSYTANEVGLGSVSNNAKLNSATGEKGDIIYWSAANTPVRLTIASSTTKKFLSVTSQALSWVTLANSDVGLGNVENKSSATIRGELTSSNVTTALGFTPYNATNPDGYTTNTGTVTSVQVQATSPLASSTNTAQTSTLNTTISLSNCTPNYVLAGPSSGTTAAAPSYRALVAADIPNHSTDKLNSGTLGVARGGTGASSFTADCAIISGSTTTSPLTTRGINNKTAAAAATTTNGNYLITNNTLYYALPKINNAKTYTSNSTFYAPTAGGTSGYVLVGAGTTSAPTWSQTVAIANGGTGATTVDAARTNLQIKYGTTAPSSAGLVNGDIYFYIQ